MRAQPFEEPQLYAVKADELAVSGRGLLDLMRAVLGRGKAFRFRARGWSMTPFIRDGDVITLAPLRAGGPRLGEVVAYERPTGDTPVVHRVVGRRGADVLIQGDSAPSAYPHELVQPSRLLGLVTRVERRGRPVWLGLGPERHAIAWLSRSGWLVPLGRRLRAWLKPLLGR